MQKILQTEQGTSTEPIAPKASTESRKQGAHAHRETLPFQRGDTGQQSTPSAHALAPLNNTRSTHAPKHLALAAILTRLGAGASSQLDQRRVIGL